MITATQVKEILGETSHNIGQLCSSSRINKWSFFKPVRSNKVTMEDDSDYYDCNDGFNIATYSTALDLISGMVNNTAWTYQPRTVYRLGDFRNYNHNATEWFQLDAATYTAYNGSVIQFTLSNDLDWLFNNFALFKGITASHQSGNLDVGFILARSWESSVKGCYYYKFCDCLDYDNKQSIIFNANLPDGTYYVVPVLTTYTNATAGTFVYITESSSIYGNWYALPCQPVEITKTTGSGGDSDVLDYVYVEASNGSYTDGSDSYGDYVSNLDFDLTVTNDYAKSATIVVTLKFLNAYVYGSVQDVTITTKQFNLDNGETGTQHISYPDQIYYLAGDVSENVSLSADINVTINNIHYTQTRAIKIYK